MSLNGNQLPSANPEPEHPEPDPICLLIAFTLATTGALATWHTTHDPVLTAEIFMAMLGALRPDR